LAVLNVIFAMWATQVLWFAVEIAVPVLANTGRPSSPV
jgi:hypothetical protein